MKWCLFLLLLLYQVTFAQTVVELSDRLYSKKLDAFIGTYVTHDNEGTELLATVSIKNSKLVLSFTQHRMVYNGGEILLALLDGKLAITEDTFRYMGGRVLIESQVTGSDSEIRLQKIMTSRFAREIEIVQFKIENGQLEFLKDCYYLRKRYKFFGDWILDTSSFNARNNARASSMTLMRTSKTPLPSSVLREFARRQPEAYYTLKTPMNADELRDAIRNNSSAIEKVVVSPHQTQRPQTAKGTVIQLPHRNIPNCQSYFTSAR